MYSIQGNTIDRDAKQNGSGISENVAHTLNGIDKHGVTYGIDQQGGKGNASYTKDIAPTLAGDSHGTPHGIAIPINTMVATRDTPETRTTFGVGEPDDPQFTISAAHEHAVFSAGFSFGQSAQARSLGYHEEMAPTLKGGDDGNQKPVVMAVDCRNGTENEWINGTLQAKEQGQSLNLNNVVRTAKP